MPEPEVVLLVAFDGEIVEEFDTPAGRHLEVDRYHLSDAGKTRSFLLYSRGMDGKFIYKEEPYANSPKPTRHPRYSTGPN